MTPHTASLADPPFEALDQDPAAILHALAADYLMLGLELQAERDGYGFCAWGRESLHVLRQDDGFAYFARGEDEPLTRAQALAFVAEKKALA